MSRDNYYYDIQKDVNTYQKGWCFIVTGGRGTGKTYGALLSCLDNERRFVFVKRTIEDVGMICAGGHGFDLSPFKPINRDKNTNIKAFNMAKGIGGFWHCDNDDQRQGDPIGYVVALSAVHKIKGFDLSDADWLIFDEFIPQPWERVSRKEGEQVLDLYKTVARDREHRGREPLRLICLANATELSNPLMNTLEVVDDVAMMDANCESVRYLDDRGIVLRLLQDNERFRQVESESMIYRAMAGTEWADVSLGNHFAYNDTTNIRRKILRRYRPMIHIMHKRQDFYVYASDTDYVVTKQRSDKCKYEYDFHRENDQKSFFRDWYRLLKTACIDGQMVFETYTMYDVIINFKRHYRIE